MTKSSKNKIYSDIFNFNTSTYYRWKEEKRPIVALIDKYFTKEDLEEFLATGKVSKYEDVENNVFSNHIRTTEILKLLSILDAETLKNTLIEALLKNNINSGTVKYLKQKRTKFEIIKIIRNLLDDLHSEKFKEVFNEYNKKIGFDFNEKDRAIFENIISRYTVYSTLYNLDREVASGR